MEAMGQPQEAIDKEKKLRIEDQNEKGSIDDQASDACAIAEKGGKKKAVKWSRVALICAVAATDIVVLLLGGGIIFLGIKVAQVSGFEERQECATNCGSCLGQCGSVYNRSLVKYLNCSDQCRALHSDRCNESCTIQAGEQLDNFILLFGNESLLQELSTNSTQIGRVNALSCGVAVYNCRNAYSVCHNNCKGKKWWKKPACILGCSLALFKCLSALVGCVF